MSKHTPGPWQVNGSHIYSADPDRAILAQAHNPGCNGGDFQLVANIRLIAAAPDLVEALTLLHAEMVASGNAGSEDYGWSKAISATRAAIAKARGETP